jgi:hypothetical protein
VFERPIYHITHKENLPGIIGEGRLWCDSQRIKKDFACRNIGYRHIKDRRLHRQVAVAAGGVLGDYVPFNFCNRSVMLYVIYRGHSDCEGGQRAVLHLVSTVGAAIAAGQPWAFTDRHAELGYALYATATAQERIVDWSLMPLVYWNNPPEVREKRQAEFLVHDQFPWSAVQQIGVYDERTAAEVLGLLAGATYRPAVTVERAWYY